MQPARNVERLSAAQVLTKLLSLMNRNARTWEDVFTEYAVFETPYTPRTPGRKIGKEAVSNFIKNALFQMQDLSYTPFRSQATNLTVTVKTIPLRQALA